MATTSTKREKKLVSKELVEQMSLVEEPSQPEKKEFLHHDHLRQLETLDRDVEIAKLTMAVEEQSLRNMVLEHHLLLSKIEKQKLALMEKAKSYDTMKAGFTSFKKELWPQYGFSEADGLGYNPNTGKIVSGN
jgi:hypothetical protein